jgi:hypothetical protein
VVFSVSGGRGIIPLDCRPRRRAGTQGRHAVAQRLEVDLPEFRTVMQTAMLAGFATSYPVNLRLFKAGVKEKM